MHNDQSAQGGPRPWAMSLPRAVLASLTGTGLLVAYLVWNSYTDARHATEATAQNLATAVAGELAAARRHTEEVLRAIARSATLVDAMSARSGESLTRLQSMLGFFLAQHPDLSHLVVYDTNGRPLAIEGRAVSAMPATDAAWFRMLMEANAPAATNAIVDPAEGKPPALIFRQRIVDAGGRFIGAITVTGELAAMSASFTGLDVGPDGALVLRRTDNNRGLLRRPQLNEVPSLPPPVTPVSRRVEAGERSGIDHYSGVDGVWRVYAFRVVDGLPLYVNAGLADNDYLADWRWRTAWLTVAAVVMLGALWLSMSRRLRSESKLAESELLFRSLSESTPAMVWMSRLDGSAVFFNPAWLQFTGRSLGEELAIEWTGDVHPDDRRAACGVYGSALKRGDPCVLEYRRRRHDGQWRWVLDTGQIRRGATGEPLGFVGTQIDITERKQAEVEMAEKLRLQQRLTTLAATVPGVIFSFRRQPDGDGYFTYVSPMLASLLQIDGEEPRSETARIMALIHPDDRTRVEESRQAAARRRDTWQQEFRVLHPQLGTIWVEAHSVAVAESDGSVSWHGFMQDATARHRAEAALRASESRFRSYIESAPISILVIGGDRVIRECNSMVGEILGYPQDAIRGRPFAELIDPNDLGIVNAAFATLVAEGLAMAEFRVCRRDGDLLWASARGSRLPDGDFLVYVLDITGRKQTEQALIESQQRYRILVERSPDAIYVSRDGIFNFVNPAAVALFGASSSADLIGRAAIELFAEHEHPLIRERRALLARGCTVPTIEQEIVRLDGGRRTVEVVVVPTVDGDGLRSELQVILRDVTERRIAERQMAQVQRMEAIGQLTGGLAHDFNNILGIILGSLDLLSEEKLDADASGLLAAAQAAANRGAEVTRSLLAIVRHSPLSSRVVDVNVLIGEMVALMQQTVGPRIVTTLDLAAPRTRVSMDPGSFDTALLNLVINARDAMPGGGHLEIRTRNRQVDAINAVAGLPDGDYLEIVVADTGGGMTPEVVARAFDPFFSTKERGKGTGLGLAMVYGFARQSGGTALIDSTPGAGTRLHLILPVATAPADDTAGPDGARLPRAQGDEQVLLVDDEADLRAICAQWLTSLGYVVTAVDSPARALMRLDAQRFDALLSDVVMPGPMDGAALAAAARDRQPHLAVLLISGYADDSVGQAAARWRLLEKPFRREQLARELRAAIDDMASQPLSA